MKSLKTTTAQIFLQIGGGKSALRVSSCYKRIDLSFQTLSPKILYAVKAPEALQQSIFSADFVAIGSSFCGDVSPESEQLCNKKLLKYLFARSLDEDYRVTRNCSDLVVELKEEEQTLIIINSYFTVFGLGFKTPDLSKFITYEY